MGLVINIRFNSTRCTPIEVQPDWNVKTLKEEISRTNSVPAEEIRIILQGREIKDDMLLSDFDLGNYSILHAVRGRKPAVTVEAKCKVMCQGLNDITGMMGATGDGDAQQAQQAEARPQYRNQFYVYCKVCSGVLPGKLRVQCSTCQQGTILMERGPCDWEDVQTSGRIQGQCQAENCQGTVAEFYFKCSGEHISQEGETAVGLNLIKPNTRDIPCLTCMTVQSPVLVFSCSDGHCMCLDCFRIYCLTAINDRSYHLHPELGYTLGCPAGCDNSYIRELHHFRIVGSDEYERYKNFGAEDYVIQQGGVLCPNPGCGAGILPEGDNKRVQCAQRGLWGCGFVFCRECLNDYHEGPCNEALRNAVSMAVNPGYSVDPHNAARARWEYASSETIKDTTKPCPKCKAPVEKDGGCSHMVCTRCHYEWCWMCHTAWNRDCQADHWFG